MQTKHYTYDNTLNPPFNFSRPSLPPGIPMSKAQVQVPKLRLFIYAVLQASSDKSKSILVALTNKSSEKDAPSEEIAYDGGTLFEPGDLLAEGKEKDDGGGFLNLGDQTASAALGYYCDRIEVTLEFDKKSMRLQKSFPTDSNDSGQTGSSNSTEVGAFGDTATGGLSNSETVSRTIFDFTMTDHTTGDTVDHAYQMSKCGDGTDYSEPKDMWPSSPEVTTAHVKPLHGAPSLARGGFPILDWAIWYIPPPPPGSSLKDPATLRVTVKAHMVFVANAQETETAVSAPSGRVIDQQVLKFDQTVSYELTDVEF